MTNVSIPTDADVVVIGGGPAGATAATLLSQQNLKTVVFERERFPRFHIGESLIPETYWVLKRLNMLPKMQRSHFVKKYSVQFVNAAGKLSAPFYFWDNKPHECSQTWQVVRSEFDKMMLDNAREHGADVHEGTRVLDVLFEGDRAAGVTVQHEDGSTHQVRAKVVVDASGQLGVLQNRFRLRVWDPVLNKGAVWTYWRGAYRDSGKDEGATMVLQTADRSGWFWYIPLHDDIVSVGIVAPARKMLRGTNREEIYHAAMAQCPAVADRVSRATRETGYFVTKDYSYRATQNAGDGWVMIGDAYAFLDPLYSSGVLLALRSGEMAADAIIDGLARGDTSGNQLGRWKPTFDQGVDRMRRLVCEYYEGFSFGAFVRNYPELRGTVTDLLIGDLFTDRVDRVWGPMESLYPTGKPRIPAWNDRPRQDDTDHIPRQRELVLPDGYKP